MTRRLLLLAAVAAVVLCFPVADGAAEPAPPTITGSTPASPANNNSPLLSGTADPLTTVNVFTDSSCAGTPVASTPDVLGPFQVQVSVADDTSTTFYASATDATSSTSPCSGGFTYVEDSTPPPAPTIDSGPTDPSGSTSASFTYSDSEPVTFACSLDGGSFLTCAQPYTVADGEHAFQVQAADAAGNTSTSSVFRWTVDTAHPLDGCMPPARAIQAGGFIFVGGRIEIAWLRAQ